MLALDTAALRAAHARHREHLPADWPRPIADAALEALLAGGLPDQRTETFRYTSLGPFADRLAAGLAAPGTGAAGAAPPLAATRVSGTAFTLTDGRRGGATDPLPAGLALHPAASALAGVRTGDLPLVDLNTAFAGDGLVLDLAADARPPGPLVIHDRALDPAAVSQPRLRLRLGAGSELTVVQVVTGAAGAGARLTLVRLQQGAAGACRLDRTELALDAGASASVTLVDLGGAPSRQDLVVLLAGDGSSIDAGGLCLAGGTSHIDHQVSIEHRGRRTISRSAWRNVADAAGRVVFNGRIVVAAGAAGTDAALTNRNLLLSARAEIDTRPELEIYTDDVRCSHGATTGQLDPAALFYLRSRGVPAAAARRLLIGAFTTGLLDRISDPGLRDTVVALAGAVLEAA
jgi:Fe-S cluster assembly protein SufD